MRGRIAQWKDGKGFGFITPDNESEKIFFHISSVKKNTSTRPKVGDSVLYESVRDSQNRLKAKTVIIEGSATTYSNNKPRKIGALQTEPKENSFLDYILISILLISSVSAIYIYTQNNNIKVSILYAIPAIISIVLLSRKKKPKEKHYSCTRCRQVTKHNERSINAWNNGFSKLYCGSCHQKWLAKNEIRNDYAAISKKGNGCLGLVAFLVVMPIILYNGLQLVS